MNYLKEVVIKTKMKVWNLSKGVGGVKPQIQTSILVLLKNILGTVSTD